eukprot:CAMPEP_0172454726 /NCGR_PEP_ID=MMETSP1065-20121228/11634_1 /TAXON_ID=265537 /ORGANISM="Amphiprora paludosa, Strain CCMP125" /LENGTH=1107 /DNA_ID=CAMNT_0013207105 /DNA_START=52 /DNA_END=3375 /DNA_ORIENTATION=+
MKAFQYSSLPVVVAAIVGALHWAIIPVFAADDLVENLQIASPEPVCLIPQDSTVLEKQVWTVGVLAIRGFEAAYREFNTTFADYLTATAGQRFDPPIEFQLKPLNFLTLFEDSEQGNVDFIYVNPSAYSCIESEYGARSLASQISRRVVGGVTYNLKRFGGVIATLANRDDIQSIHDLKDKIVATASISGLGSGQMQFREMQNAGMSYINDPKQMVFTSNQGKVVKGVLSGEFDVGFIRTDQLERSQDADGNPIDLSMFKVIDPKGALSIDRIPFPFESSTELYPEWNIASLDHVPDEVSSAVQTAMLQVGSFADLASARQACEEDPVNCDNYQAMPRTCEATADITELAANASAAGKYSRWIPSLSYMELRSMQEATGFIERREEDNVWRCLRSATLYDSISCPAEMIKKTQEQVESGCETEGLECAEGYQCVCTPCYEVFECIDSIDIGGNCVAYSVFLPAILVPIAVIFIAACFITLGYKSRQMVQQAKAAAKNERDLNEFIAHEVRNPLSAALSASVFVNTAVQAEVDEDTMDNLREDANIISSSLRFINDLLRSMLDVQRATRDQMVLEQDNIDILCDIFQPAASMIYARDTNFVVTVDCPEGLIIRGDRLRLQQVILNLARNSAKFVVEGFVRLRAEVIENHVHLFVEDSGPGIPEEKRKSLFNKYQKSLDSLAQGTGVGLSLVEKLVNLMEGSIWLDEAYRSGYKNYPGARLVIDLKKEPEAIVEDEFGFSDMIDLKVAQTLSDFKIPSDVDQKLPMQCRVLLVDDDHNLRKFARRLLKVVRPTWTIEEAASGEACLHACGAKEEEKEPYDLIFMDQYMTSVDQCLKGTETVRALRTRGIKSIICGLSANDLDDVFAAAGADLFHLKPFPSDPYDVCKLLVELFEVRDFALEEEQDEFDAQNQAIIDTNNIGLEDTVADLTSSEEEGSVPVDENRSLRSNGRSIRSSLSVPSGSADTRSRISNLPDSLSVLIVDDDRTLRRLCTRGLKGIHKNIHIRDVSSGEAALALTEAQTFDIIFMDQYMTSVNESILRGIDTIKLMRERGVKSLICGLSANEQEHDFLDAGANYFQLKPLPCSPPDLEVLLEKILAKRRRPSQEQA